MDKTEQDAIAKAYGTAWAKTQDLDAAYEAATVVFRELHPEFTDPALISCLVAITISGAISQDADSQARRR
jgi:hypothetical protein